MEIVETWKTIPKRPVSLTNRKACLVHIYPTGPGMGSLYSLGEAPQIVGRGEDCNIHLEDQSISRNHVRIQPGGDGHYAIDLHSTNGTFVNDQPVSMHKLKDGDFLRIGNRIFRYLIGDSIEAHYHEEIYRLTIIDALTGIHNKRYLLEFLERELARAGRYQRPLGLIMFDLDRFKSINDRLGHLGGDYALRELVRAIKGSVRKEELLARYGGEEFAVVLPETTRSDAIQLAERFRQLVEQHTFEFGEDVFHVTISLGVITTPETEALSPEVLIRLADEKLFQAKNAGRNCTVG